MKYSVLLVDDDDSIRFVVSKFLTRAGYIVKATDNPQTLVKWVEAGEGDVVLTDVHMGAEEIFSYVPHLKSVRPELPIIVISANTRMITALKSRKTGVFDYIPKPFDLAHLQNTIERALKPQIKEPTQMVKQPDQMIGRSEVMQPVFRAISDYASGDVAVFIWGNAGTGKNLTAQCVHNSGARAHVEFVRFDRLENSHDIIASVGSGDLFVDRVHELNDERQTCLLEALEYNEDSPSSDKFRTIVASTVSLEKLAQNQLLRTDLLSHLMGGRIYLPPLVERVDDMGDLASFFLSAVRPNGRWNIEDSAVDVLNAHSWPGNIRELRNLMHVIALQFPDVTITDDIIERMLTPQYSTSLASNLLDNITLACKDLLNKAQRGERPVKISSYDQALEWVEKPLIEEALRITGGNNSKAADLLGIHRNTLRAKLRK